MTAISYKLNKAQMEFIRSKEKMVAIVSGVGGGKSWALQLQTLLYALEYPDALHCYVSLSYGLMRDASIPAFTRFLEDTSTEFEFIKSEYAFIINGKTKVIFRSQDAADRLRSVEVGSLMLDEAAYFDPDNFRTLVGRLRDKNGPLVVRIATTPKGLNFFWELFVQNANEGRRMIKASTYDNKHLPPDYIDMLKNNYDSRLQMQEIEGEFIAANASRAFYCFDEMHVAKVDYRAELGPIYMGNDFNTSKLVCILCQKDGETLRVFDEILLENSNTFEMAKAMEAKIKALGHRGSTLVIPDSTGSARKTCSTKTDHQILREAGFTLPAFRNPLRKDRFNNCNSRLEKGLVMVDARCKTLLTDLRTFDGVEEHGNLGHMGDAWGYVLWHLFPMIKREVKSGFIL